MSKSKKYYSLNLVISKEIMCDQDLRSKLFDGLVDLGVKSIPVETLDGEVLQFNIEEFDFCECEDDEEDIA